MSDSREAMRAAVEALEECRAFFDNCPDYDGADVNNLDTRCMDALSLLRAALEAREEPAGMKEVELNIIRFWPDGMADRLEHVWKDVIGFIPNYKLYDLQRVLAEFGFTMKVYERAASPAAAPVEAREEQRPVAYVPRCIADDADCIVGEYNWDEIAEEPFAMWKPEHWECAPLYASPAAATQGDASPAMFDAFGNQRCRHVRITVDGTHLICEPHEVEENLEGLSDPIVTDVYLSEQERDALPEFQGW